MNRVSWCLIIILSVTLNQYGYGLDLPKWDSKVTQYLSQKEIKEIGLKIYRENILSDPKLIIDYEINASLQKLANKLIASSKISSNTNYNISVFNSEVINASAIIGGHIIFYTGLILLADNEQELASVMAHEIAHIHQAHHIRSAINSEDNYKKSMIISILAEVMAQSIIKNETTKKNISKALWTSAIAYNIEDMLVYSREFEEEADAVGQDILAKSGYDSLAGVSFFQKMYEMRQKVDSKRPDYLLTHPLPSSRIANIKNRSTKETAYQTPEASLSFLLLQQKIKALHQPLDTSIEEHIADLDRQSGRKLAAVKYALGWKYLQASKYGLARNYFMQTLDDYPDNIALKIAIGNTYIEEKKYSKASGYFEQVSSQHPYNDIVMYYLAHAQMKNKQNAKAQKIIKAELKKNPNNLAFLKLLSQTYVNLNKKTEANIADADYHLSIGDYKKALHSLQLALRQKDISTYYKESVEAKIESIKFEQNP